MDISKTQVKTLAPLTGLDNLEAVFALDTPIPDSDVDAIQKAMPTLAIAR